MAIDVTMDESVVGESRISSGNFTVVPARVRQVMGARAGDKLEWRLLGSEIVVRVRRLATVEDITGVLSHGGDAVASKRAVQGLRGRVR